MVKLSLGLLSLFKNINLGFGHPHMPMTTSTGTMEDKEFTKVEQDNKMGLAGDHREITAVEKDTRIRSDETGSDTFVMDRKFNHPLREGARGPENITSSENVGQIECKFYLLPGGCKFGNDCRSLHHVRLNFLGLPIRLGEKECPFYMRTGGCKFASHCRFHHPDPTAVIGDSFQDLKNGVPSQHHVLAEQLCETPMPSENPSNEQTDFLGPFTPNRGFQENVHRKGNQTTTSPLHSREMNINDQRQILANRDTAEEYPQRPGEPECQYFMKTGYCKFKSACRYHHPKSNVSFLGLPQRSSSQQLRETPLPSENTSKEQTAFLGPSSSYVPDLFTPSHGLKTNAQWNGSQAVTSLLYPQETKIINHQQELASKDAAYEFSGGEPQQHDEYPQRPGKPECQFFMKTGQCKFKSACRYHHPKSNLSFPSLPLRSASNNYEQNGSSEQLSEIPLSSENALNDQRTVLSPSSSNVQGLFTPEQGLWTTQQWNGDQMATNPLHPPEIKKNEEKHELANTDTAYDLNGGVKSQQLDEYPQRPNEPECRYFMKTGHCKLKSACRYHHPKSNRSLLTPPLKPDKPICTYYGRGICKFGSACRYSHHMEHT
ncbi:zinc finger CCCH domain-containing protein 65 isoform X3 [Dendrobium catenatum]|uniref:zinc finger CCCH domain-containing protein 65 isoform X3 n=1 Tax=Dendrobium catenatum TaxID=906689 RepID=UPI0009F26838|nr:zinc finger CCCH domain-containing protein 65 isoform X3 [Dendrobium catenatum]